MAAGMATMSDLLIGWMEETNCELGWTNRALRTTELMRQFSSGDEVQFVGVITPCWKRMCGGGIYDNFEAVVPMSFGEKSRATRCAQELGLFFAAVRRAKISYRFSLGMTMMRAYLAESDLSRASWKMQVARRDLNRFLSRLTDEGVAGEKLELEAFEQQFFDSEQIADLLLFGDYEAVCRSYFGSLFRMLTNQVGRHYVFLDLASANAEEGMFPVLCMERSARMPIARVAVNAGRWSKHSKHVIDRFIGVNEAELTRLTRQAQWLTSSLKMPPVTVW
ncbi:hypothetical protein IJJ27_01275 [bacterium]|nr:hypothetical protein [bacterium]